LHRLAIRKKPFNATAEEIIFFSIDIGKIKNLRVVIVFSNIGLCAAPQYYSANHSRQSLPSLKH
jgi:hypothetical protein